MAKEADGYKCRHCNVDMIAVPCLGIKGYGENGVEAHIVASGYFNGQSKGVHDDIHIGSSTYMCPECGFVETHICNTDRRMLARYYDKGRN